MQFLACVTFQKRSLVSSIQLVMSVLKENAKIEISLHLTITETYETRRLQIASQSQLAIGRHPTIHCSHARTHLFIYSEMPTDL